MAKTYSSLYPLVIKEIDKRIGKNVVTVDSRFNVQPSGEGGSLDSRSISEMVSSIFEDLSEIIGPKILSGLDVSATTPASMSITITAGTATSNGKLWELLEDTTVAIPLNSSTYLFFVTIYNNTIEISTTYDSTKCELCRIVVPKPGITINIVDNKPKDGYDAYIVSAKDIVYKEDQQFDDVSIAKLRDVIGDILADNLIGNIRLSENLKIINTQSSLELDSSSIKIKGSSDNILAKFDRNGTFFYNDIGVEMARFTNIDARIGNILITKNSLVSTNFVSGALGSGFQILDSGDAEFNNILVRGKFKSAVFEKDTISAVGGNLLVMDSDILDSDMTVLDSSTLIISGDTSFAIGDILRIKDGVDDEWLEVTSIIYAPIYNVNRDKANSYTLNNKPAWKKGTTVVNYRSSDKGGIFMTSSELNAPYLSVLTHAGSPWSTTTTHLRLGNLNGFLGYSANLFGIAIGSANAYLKYDPTNGMRILGSSVISSLSGARIEMFPDVNTGIIAYNSISGEIFKILVGGSDSGDLIIGDFVGNKGLKWDQSDSTFTVRGILNADDITAGTLTGRTIQTAVSGARILLDTSNLVAYNSNLDEVFKVLISGTDTGDVIIGDYANSKGIKWDNSGSSFNIKGIITATAGDFTGTVNVGTAAKVYIDGANECIKVYDGSSNLRVQIGKLS